MTIRQAFELALEHHQAGRLGEAEAIYQQILAAEPHHAGALHFLGVIAHQMGRNDVAVEQIRRAIALAPGVPDFHTNLGEALRATGELIGAIAAYREAIALKPDFAIAHNNLAGALKENGQLEEAIATYRHAICLQPDLSRAHSNLILALDFLDGADVAQQQAERRRWDEQHARRSAAHIQPHDNEPDPARRLRVGYVSADFCRHSAVASLPRWWGDTIGPDSRSSATRESRAKTM